MQNVTILLDLPVETVAVLAAGYVAYRIAFTGKDRTHTIVDTLLLTVAFSFVAKASIALMADAPGRPPDPMQLGTGMLSALAASALWRSLGAPVAFRVLRWLGISASDRHGTAWETITARERAGPSQLVVRKTDGGAVMCERLADFADAPFGPCIYGQDGSIALYITHYRQEGETDWTGAPDAPGDWGRSISYIPASGISEIAVRHASLSLGLWWRGIFRGARRRLLGID